MAASVHVEMDRELVCRLRALYPGRTDRELIERLAITDLGMATFRDSQRRNADPEEVVLEEAVRAVQEARDEMQRRTS